MLRPAHVAECLQKAVTVTRDFEYKASSADVKIFERLQKRRTGRTCIPVALKTLQDIISPQPEAMSVLKRLLSWIDRVDWCSQRGEGKPPFTTPEGDPIFPPPNSDGEAVLWWPGLPYTIDICGWRGGKRCACGWGLRWVGVKNWISDSNLYVAVED